MQNKHKVLTETGIVCALAVVLTLVLMRGFGRNLSWLSRVLSGLSLEQPSRPTATSPQSTAGRRESSSTTPPVVAASTPAQGADGSGEGRLAQINYTALSTRDPFVSLLPKLSAPVSPLAGTGANSAMGTRAAPGSPAQPPPTLHVQGILWGDLKPKAIINERVYRINETVEGVTIKSIDARGVTIEHQGALVSYPVGGSPPQPTKPSMGRPTGGR